VFYADTSHHQRERRQKERFSVETGDVSVVSFIKPVYQAYIFAWWIAIHLAVSL
jgi:hypothetical protein